MRKFLFLDHAIQRKLEGINYIVFEDIINHLVVLSKTPSGGFNPAIQESVSPSVSSPHNTVPVHRKELYSPFKSEVKMNHMQTYRA